MKEPNRVTIGAVPWGSGLWNQGGQATMPETALWEARNVTSDNAGRLFKRPGAKQWGQTLYMPDPEGLQYQETFEDMGSFSFSSAGNASDINSAIEDGMLVMWTKTLTADKVHTYARQTQPSDGTIEAGESNRCTVLFHVKAVGALPDNDGTAEARGFSVSMRSSHANVLTLVFVGNGIYYYTGAAYAAATTTAIDDGAWHAIQVRITSATAAQILIDDTSVASITFGNDSNFSLSANQVQLRAETNTLGIFRILVDLFQYRSGSGTLNGAPVQALKDWHSPNPSTPHLVAVTRSMIYQDQGHQGFFRSLVPPPYGDVIMVPWLSELLICGSSGVALRWEGIEPPITVPPSMPKNIIAASSHQARVYCTKAEEPLNVYFSGANDLDDWTTGINQVGDDSSAFPIPDPKGKRITAMRGDFYGLLIIWTESSTWIWRSGGDPVNDGVLQLVSANVGCVGPEAHDAVGRDVMFLSNDGLHSLSTVQEFGDISSASISSGIRGLWQTNPTLDQKRIIRNRRSRVVHIPSLAKTYVSVQRQGDPVLASIYEFNHDTKMWTGPWAGEEVSGGSDLECISMDGATIGGTGVSVLMVSTNQGEVVSMDSVLKADFSNTDFPMRIKSARLDGRSLDPSFIRKVKQWRYLRLFILPRDGWRVKVSWNVDGQAATDSQTMNTNVYKEPLLTTTFALGESALGDSERIGIITVPLDTRGRWLEFTIELEQDLDATADQDLVVVGFEVDALIGGEEKEN